MENAAGTRRSRAQASRRIGSLRARSIPSSPDRWREEGAPRLHRIPETGFCSQKRRFGSLAAPGPERYPAPRMARIVLSTPEGQQVVQLRDHNSLGRHPSNSLQLLDKIVSKEHCVIERRGNHFVLRDLGSLNGTYVNGERVNGEQILRHGDDIALGSTRARFDDESGIPIPPPAPYGSPLPPPGSAPFPPGSSPGVAPVGSPPESDFGKAATDRTVQAFPIGPSPSPPLATTTRVDVHDRARSIGTQIAATNRGFLPYELLAGNPQQLAQDYERLRLS